MNVVVGTHGKDCETLLLLFSVLAETQDVIALDAAPRYGNLTAVGRAIKKSGLPRSAFYITTKINASRQRELGARQSLELDLREIGINYVDQYLIHSSSFPNFPRTWKEMIELKKEGAAHRIGVSTFTTEDLLLLKGEKPAVVQVPPMTEYISESMLGRYRNSGTRIEGYSFVRKLSEFVQRDSNAAEAIKKRRLDIGSAACLWCCRRGIIPILGTNNTDHLRMCCMADEFLYDDEIDCILGGILQR